MGTEGTFGVPSDWMASRLGRVASCTLGGTPSTAVRSYWGGPIPWMSSGDVHIKRIFDVPGRITQAGLDASNATLVDPPAVAVALAGQGKTRGTVALVNVRLCTNQSIALLKGERCELDTRYLFHDLSRRYVELRARSSGGGRAGLSRRVLDEVPVLLPPVPEQQRIADILDTLDEAIRKTEQLIAKLTQVKQGLLRDLLTRGIDDNGELRDPGRHPEQFVRHSLGRLPIAWRVMAAGELCESIVPGRNKPVLGGGDLPWITVSDLTSVRIAKSVSGLSLTRRALENAGGRTVPPEAVVMSCIGSFGVTAIAAQELVINQQLHGFVCKALVTPEWLAYFLANQGTYMDRMATQTTIKYLNKAACEAVPVAVPPLEEQKAICGQLATVERSIASEVQLLAKASELKVGLVDDLLTGRVRVTSLIEQAA
jgi:type I restriction enzyme, S subunit